MSGLEFGTKLGKQIAAASLSLALVGAGGIAWAEGDGGAGAPDAVAQASSVGAEAPEERLFTLTEAITVMDALAVGDVDLEGFQGLQDLGGVSQGAGGGN